MGGRGLKAVVPLLQALFVSIGMRTVRRFAREGRKLGGSTDAQAHGMNCKGAVAAMDKATGQLNWAQQYLGVPVF